MKIRIISLPEEAEQAADLIARALDVIEVSEPYPSRGNSRNVRIYIEARLP
ncbi:hypothetical protein AB0K60_07060 [Thermopolyspora sp. NPDC052614]|uniref:hypothetical protein n=1 Tax=Thermopolyspora sp. NPDC052614 TaxID=3155682 RepID=UPI003430E5B8